MAVFIAALYGSGFVSICIHELGHSLAIKLVGGQLFCSTIGAGPLVRRFRLRSFDIEIRGNLFGGGAVVYYFYPNLETPWKSAVIFAGGAIANCTAAALLFGAVSAGADQSAPTLLLTVGMGAATSQLLIGLFSLVPRTFPRDGRRHASDGQQILNVLISKTDSDLLRRSGILHHAFALCRAKRFTEAVRHCSVAWATHPDAGALFGLVVHSLGRSVGPSQAVQFYLNHAEILDGELAGGEAAWAFANGNVAWHALMAHQPDWLPLADKLSGRAFEAFPMDPSLRATRGAVLVALGGEREGLEMVETGLKEIGERIDKAEFCDFLARSAHASGDAALAAEFGALGIHLRAEESRLHP